MVCRRRFSLLCIFVVVVIVVAIVCHSYSLLLLLLLLFPSTLFLVSFKSQKENAKRKGYNSFSKQREKDTTIDERISACFFSSRLFLASLGLRFRDCAQAYCLK